MSLNRPFAESLSRRFGSEKGQNARPSYDRLRVFVPVDLVIDRSLLFIVVF